jgi:hypothetical protein
VAVLSLDTISAGYSTSARRKVKWEAPWLSNDVSSHMRDSFRQSVAFRSRELLHAYIWRNPFIAGTLSLTHFS